ncbi:hypothetical protein RHGRI_000593 [Rhododendron griersonianum]|uniref:Uncharacterized protein n=1 Tax=Rhododendron griersonianum TaxID=479676 RepID=A0AAV6LI85_9ERIC|nr:hypothetical protein RHGRI_000593 [Rhododendron griersonianum]
MEQNAAIFESLGLKSLANGLFGSNSSTKKKSCKLVKSKTGSGNDDVDYEQDEGEEGMSSSNSFVGWILGYGRLGKLLLDIEMY